MEEVKDSHEFKSSFSLFSLFPLHSEKKLHVRTITFTFSFLSLRTAPFLDSFSHLMLEMCDGYDKMDSLSSMLIRDL